MVLALFFVADDELAWREDDAGRINIENAGRCLMKVDPGTREVCFLSLFERRFVPVDRERAEKALALTAFLRDAPLEKGTGVEFDYPLRNKSYHFRLYVASLGKLRLTTWPDREFRCARLAGDVTGWDRGRKTTIDAYVGSEGEFARRILKLTFKFTDWPGVTLTLSGGGVN